MVDTKKRAGFATRFPIGRLSTIPCDPFAEIPLAYALIHFFIVTSSIATEGSGVTAPLSEFNDVFDPSGDSQQAFMGMVTNYPNFVAEEWCVPACFGVRYT